MEHTNDKYPRTYHLPWSPGTTSDDKKLSGDWFDNYKGREIVITEKLDGENTAMTRYNVFARSHVSPTRSPWTRNMWEADSFFWRIKDKIGENETVFGENLFGVHSIYYNRLPAYYHIFAVRDDERSLWLSWDDVVSYAYILGLPSVPVIWRGIAESEEQIKSIIDETTKQPSAYGDGKEGVVMRVVDEFPVSDFSKCVCKWVRPNHVQTDEHWTKNWQRAKLMWEYGK